MFPFEKLPVDLVQPILSQLDDRRDLTVAAIVCRSFNYAATPLIYRTVDAGIKDKNVLHPSATLLRRPELAQYVWHVTETGDTVRKNPYVMGDITAALRLCTNLVSVTWWDRSKSAEVNFMPILEVLMTLPLKELNLHTQYDIGDRAWALLNKMSGIRRLSVWSLDWGPPRVLQGWAELLGPTLTHLELGRCAGVPPTVLISVFLQLPLLRDLRVRGVPSAAIPSIMACLPKLTALDTDYNGRGKYRSPHVPLPSLRSLTVQASSVDVLGPDQLWRWISSLIPHGESLQSFSLASFAVQGQIAIPHPFIIRLIRLHGKSLKRFTVAAAEITPDALLYLSRDCPLLEELECSGPSPNVHVIAKVAESAKNLRSLQLNVHWTEDEAVNSSGRVGRYFRERTLYGDHTYPSCHQPVDFSAEEAMALMLQKGSKLRAIRLGANSYTGRWVHATMKRGSNRDGSSLAFEEGNVIFEVTKDNYPHHSPNLNVFYVTRMCRR